MSARILSFSFAAVLLLGACALPRGAALQSEIARASDAENASFAVQPVTRASLPALQRWPRTGDHPPYRWLEARSGPRAPRIRPGDRLSVTLWDNQANSLITEEGQKQSHIPDLTVSPSGHIFLPYAGEVQVSGQSPEAARKTVQDALERIAPGAQALVQFAPGTANTVDLVSGFRASGSYPLEDQNQTVMGLIARAGGLDPELQHPIVQLQRGDTTYRLPARVLFADARKNITLRGRDQITVIEDERYFIALGATGREQQVSFERDEITALEALSMTGGVNDSRANLKGILVLREYAPDQLAPALESGPQKAQTVFVLDLTSAEGLFAARNFPIYPDDTLLATESAVTSVRTVFGLVGSLLGIANAAS